MASLNTEGRGKNKRWIVRYDAGVSDTGKRIQKQKTFKTGEEAEDFRAYIRIEEKLLEQLMSRGMTSKKPEVVQVTFKEFATKWFHGEYYGAVRESTFKPRQSYLDNQILPFFGEKNLSKIDGDTIGEFYIALKKKGNAPKTISIIHKLLTTLFHTAVIKGYLDKTPMEQVRRKPKDIIRKVVPWSMEEVERFLKVAEEEGKDVLYDYYLNTGVRQGEVLALTWNAIDFEKQSVNVSQSLFISKTSLDFLVKSESSNRTISIPSHIVEKLKRHKEKKGVWKKRIGENWTEYNLVFPNLTGGFLNPSNVRRQMYNLMKKAKVRRITFHQLRHTHASLLIG